MSDNKLPNINQLSVKANQIYRAIDQTELETNRGCYVAIELDSGEYFFGETKDIAVQKAKDKHPTKLIFIRRVGEVEKMQRFTKPNAPLAVSRMLGTHARVF